MRSAQKRTARHRRRLTAANEARASAWMSLVGAFGMMVVMAALPALDVEAAPMLQNTPDVVEDSEPPPLNPRQAAQQDPAQLVAQVVTLVNAERAKQGAGPLQANDNLMRSAQDYSVILGQGTCFEHTCAPVPELRNRVTNAGYGGFSRIGENIAAGDQTAEAVVASWMTSPGHRANILNPEFKEIGVGVTRSQGEFGIYWVQVFGTRAQG